MLTLDYVKTSPAQKNQFRYVQLMAIVKTEQRGDLPPPINRRFIRPDSHR